MTDSYDSAARAEETDASMYVVLEADGRNASLLCQPGATWQLQVPIWFLAQLQTHAHTDGLHLFASSD